MLVSLSENTQSNYFAKKQGWKFPASRDYLALADLIDLTISVNVGAKDKGKVKPYPRPYQTEGEKLPMAKMSIERAIKLYRPKRRTKTDEEVLALNKIFIEEEKTKKL